MTDTLKSKLGLIGEEIIRVANENFTGELNISLHMKNGGIGQISVLIKKNLLDKCSNRHKNKD